MVRGEESMEIGRDERFNGSLLEEIRNILERIELHFVEDDREFYSRNFVSDVSYGEIVRVLVGMEQELINNKV